jgi:hypothetical protein
MKDMQTYIPKDFTVPKDFIYARDCLLQHDSVLGRTTYKNKTWAETIEKDILQMEKTLEDLRSL